MSARVHPVRRSPSVAGRPVAVLSPEQLEALRRRLIVLAVIVAAVTVAVQVSGLLAGLLADARELAVLSQRALLLRVSTVALGLVSAALAVVVARKAEDELGLERLGIALAVVTAGLSGLGRHGVAAELGLGLGLGWSGVSMLVMLLPVLLPLTPRRAVAVGVAVTALDVAGFSLAAALAGSLPSAAEYVMGFRGDLIGVGVAWAVASVVDDLRVRLFGARKLGSYELLERLGEGGMGEVWRARHGLLARPAAIKLIKTDALAGMDEGSREMMLARFEREARATAQLESPHTIDVYDFGVADDGTLYYAMELLQGIDLHEFIVAYGRMPPARVAYLMLQMCESLGEAHARGLVHRDIKPSNLFLCDYGGRVDFIKVLDFGLVKLVDPGPEAAQLTGDGFAGTPAFLAPEQALSGREVDARSDIYALGCVGYWLLTDHFLFEARSAAEHVVQHVNETPVPPSQRVAIEVPAEFEALIMQTLAKDPGARPQTAEQLAARIRATGLAQQWDEQRARRWWAERGARRAADEPEVPATELLASSEPEVPATELL